MAEQTSIRANQLPPGGVTTTTQAGQGQPLMPDTFTLKRISEQFMERSESNVVQMNKVNLPPSQRVSFQLRNVGLGESLELYVSGKILLNNTASTAQAVSFAPEFPYNLLQQILVAFNGQTQIIGLSGYEALGMMSKRVKNLYVNTQASGGAVDTLTQLARVPSTVAWVKAGANVTLTAGNGLTGVSGASIAANSEGEIDFGFYLLIPFTLRSDLLLGLLPMQNNSVYADVTLVTPAFLGSDASFPIYVSGGVPSTLVVDTAQTKVEALPTYNFWAIPVPNDPSLYGYLVSHNYMLLSQGPNTVATTGTEALQYLLPNNYYLLGLLFTLRDGNNDLLNIPTALENPYLSYNGTARVDRRDIHTRLARQTLFNEGIPAGLGHLLMDLTDTEYLPNNTNTTKWLNMYLANNPMVVADILSGVATPVKYWTLREQLVPANVQII